MPENRQHPMRSDPGRPELIHLLGHAERTAPHTHPQGHLVYPATGVLSLVTSDGSWVAPPNRVVWTPAGVEHQHRAHGAADMRIVFVARAEAASLPAGPAVLAVTPLAREAALALTSGRPRDAAARARLRGVLLDELTTTPEQPLHLPEPRDDRLRAVTRHVERHLESPDTLAHIGRRVGAGERTLSRLFREETGMGFRQWRTQLRIHRALLLLADGRSVTDTAVACGWANPTAFIDAFTALVGQTPGHYRRGLHG
jgi:AraC-like DNA-binding protein